MTNSTDRARALRRNMTDAEQFVWSRLRTRRFAGYKFRRQVPLGKYVVDFVCFNRRLIIELDGGQHTLQCEYDTERTQWLESRGFRVLRFWNHDVFQQWETIGEVVWRALVEEPLAFQPLTPDPTYFKDTAARSTVGERRRVRGASAPHPRPLSRTEYRGERGEILARPTLHPLPPYKGKPMNPMYRIAPNALTSRRAFLGRAAGGIGSLALASLLDPRLLRADSIAADGKSELAPAAGGVLKTLHFPARAKRVIWLYMAGGMSHLETFDYKPKLAEMNGQPMPESFTAGQQIAQLQGAKLNCFAPQHQFDAVRPVRAGNLDRVSAASAARSPTRCASSARCTPKRSTTTRPTRS